MRNTYFGRNVLKPTNIQHDYKYKYGHIKAIYRIIINLLF
jgi:hypothetical protein